MEAVTAHHDAPGCLVDDAGRGWLDAAPPAPIAG